MLARLFGKKDTHPLADIQSARLLLADLPNNDALKSAMVLTELIGTVTASKEYKLLDQFEVFSLLDETAQPYLRKLAADYFSLADLNNAQGSQLCQVLGELSLTGC